MDALLDAFRTMSLTGGLFLDAEFTAPWCVTSQVDTADHDPLLPPPAHLIGYHYVTEGRLWLDVQGREPFVVNAGEIIVLPQNQPHRLGSALAPSAISAGSLIRPGDDGGLARIVHGGGGECTRILCGFLGSQRPEASLVSLLPSVLTLAIEAGASSDWIESSFRFAARELASGQRGSPAVLARLAELLFIEAVRRHLASMPAERGGWVAGLRDPIVARALASLHGRPEHRWTTEALAREAGASRSVFAERFTQIMGEPPIRYLARWRLEAASRQLGDSHLSIAQIAEDAGYESEAAFTRAFKRHFGAPPAAWRRQQQSGG